jgi:hypothetical protein
MKIEKAKLIQDGYLVNGTISVPKCEKNRHYRELKAWLETNTAEQEFTAEQLEEQRIAGIKSKAAQVINNKYSDVKQRNMLARFTELQGMKIDNIALSDDEVAEYAALKSAWNWIKSIRIKSNEAETNSTLVKDIDWS